MVAHLNYKILVLNRLWQAVNIVGVHRGFSLLLQDHAQVIYTRDSSFRLMDSNAWLKLSETLEAQSQEDLREKDAELESANDAYVQTIRLKILVPKVLLLRSYGQVPVHEVKFNRENLFDRDNYQCQYCGNQMESAQLNMDHVIPRDQGGKTSWENIVTACIQCNSRKANRLPHQAQMHLIKKPERPRWRPFISSLIGQSYEKDWEHFLNLKKLAQ
ncbi:MAG: HNH endonuclease [Puniceicoccaceae bacterium]|nr:HNH endonuclease [Puniceicoccaceae bacterium]RCL30475.1 MAG: HNH endonuclease [Puniceicoccaceae bacterium]